MNRTESTCFVPGDDAGETPSSKVQSTPGELESRGHYGNWSAFHAFGAVFRLSTRRVGLFASAQRSLPIYLGLELSSPPRGRRGVSKQRFKSARPIACMKISNMRLAQHRSSFRGNDCHYVILRILIFTVETFTERFVDSLPIAISAYLPLLDSSLPPRNAPSKTLSSNRILRAEGDEEDLRRRRQRLDTVELPG